MLKHRVFVTDSMRGLADAAGCDPLAPVRAVADCTVWESSHRPSVEDLREGVHGQDALLCLLTDPVDASVIEAGDALRVISSVSVGVDHIDLTAASVRGIPVGHTPGVLTETTADLAFALMLAVGRRLVEADADLRAGGWKNRWELDGFLGRDMHGATLGLIGLGGVGMAVARRAAAFGMRILGWSRSDRTLAGVERVELDQLLSDSDFVSVNLASTPETRGLVDAAALARMKPGAILVNTARGDVVVEADVVAALESGHLGGVGLDVFDHEPIKPDHPLIGRKNVVLTPHIASASIATRLRMAERAVENLLDGLEGRPLPHCANARDLDP